jgi:hypothetical protein
MDTPRDRMAPPTQPLSKSCAASGPARRVALRITSLRSRTRGGRSGAPPYPDPEYYLPSYCPVALLSHSHGLDVPATPHFRRYTAAAPQPLVSDGQAKAHVLPSVEREVLEIRRTTYNFPRESVSSDACPNPEILFFLPRKATTATAVHGGYWCNASSKVGLGACREPKEKHPHVSSLLRKLWQPIEIESCLAPEQGAVVACCTASFLSSNFCRRCTS